MQNSKPLDSASVEASSNICSSLLAFLQATHPDSKSPSLKSKKNLIIGVSGSVAAVKIPKLSIKFIDLFNVVIVPTQSALFFINSEETVDSSIPVITDSLEWYSWNYTKTKNSTRFGTVLHIYLRNWADCLVIAPLDANSLGKISSGICDNLLTCVARCWDFKKPIFMAPAMNTFMWDHPVTSNQISLLLKWGFILINPIPKTLACGDIGNGAMASLESILENVTNCLFPSQTTKSSFKQNIQKS